MSWTLCSYSMSMKCNESLVYTGLNSPSYFLQLLSFLYFDISISTGILTTCMYRKRQKLSERKVSWFTGFHPNVGKTFVAFISTVWKGKSIAQLNIRWENFCGSSKIHKTFLPLNFCCLRYMIFRNATQVKITSAEEL